MSPHIHILSFNVPYPPDYGGVIDVFAKIKALHAEGVQIHLHCFTYNRPEAKELESICASVHYYPRNTVLSGISLRSPYIVSSRASEELIKTLDKDNYPILAEGMHTSWSLLKKKWPGRKVAIRLHNVEAEYYQQLASTESNPFKRAYLRRESRLLEVWESQTHNIPLIAIHPNVARQFKETYHNNNVEYLPAFTPWTVGENPTGNGAYLLFHGDLSVADNVKSLEWLLDNVWSQNAPPWIVAGRKPGQRVITLLKKYPAVRLESDPSSERMDELVKGAQIHLVHSFNPTGIKIKLLHALFQGRYCIAHASLLEGLGLEETCQSAITAEDFQSLINDLWSRPFTETEKSARERLLSAQFDNSKNARKFMEWMGLDGTA